MTINKYGTVPLYFQLKNIILEKIKSGEYPEDSRIPSEQEFCELYDISRPTVRQAIIELTNSGHLYKEKGRGTFVSKTKKLIDIKNYNGFTDSILDCSVPGEKNIISVAVKKGSEVSQLNEVFAERSSSRILDEEFAEIVYLSGTEENVLAMNLSYIPLQLFPDIINDVTTKKPSYEILKGKYPLIPIKSKSSLEVIFTDQNDAQFLRLQIGQVLIRIENVLYSRSGQIVEFIISKYRADKCLFLFENIKFT